MKMFRFLLFFMCFGVLISQNRDSTEELESQIQELLQQNDIIAVNRLLNTNTSLDPEFAYSIINQNLEKAQSESLDKEYADTYITLGNFWYSKGNHAKAYDSYLKSETISKQIKDMRMEGISIMNRSHILENREEKIELLKQAIIMLGKVKDTINLAKAHLNLGNVYSKDILNNFNGNREVDDQIERNRKNAYANYSIAETLNQTLKSPEISASVNVHMAEWYKFEKDYQKARESFKKAEGFFGKSGQIKGKVYVLQQLSQIEIEVNNLPKALQLLETAESISKDFEYYDYLVQIYQLYFEIYKKKNDFSKALEYYEHFHQSSIKLNELNSRDKIHSINIENKLKENEHLLERSVNQRNTYRIIAVASLIFLAFIIGISYLLIKNKRRKIESIQQKKMLGDIKIKNQQLQEELLKEKLKFNQEHLISFAGQVSKIEDFLDRLKSQVKSSEITTRDDVNALKISFSEILDDQNYIKELNSYAKDINQDFLLYVKKNHQKLTKRDEQLLSFLILDMSSKEIASILKISTESVHTKRYRLRKKLNIENDESFLEFYKRTIDKL